MIVRWHISSAWSRVKQIGKVYTWNYAKLIASVISLVCFYKVHSLTIIGRPSLFEINLFVSNINEYVFGVKTYLEKIVKMYIHDTYTGQYNVIVNVAFRGMCTMKCMG